MEADADILLIDEVLAVGDAAFQQKSADAFHEMKAAGKTIILVTHEMGTVEHYCHRAMLIDGGRIQHLGDPGDVGRHYLQLNFEEEPNRNFDEPVEEPVEEAPEEPVEEGPVAIATPSDEMKLVEGWLEDEEGNRIANLGAGEKLRLRLELEALREISGADVGFIVADAEGVGVTSCSGLMTQAGELAELRPGDRILVRAEIENLLTQGRYFVHFGVNRIKNRGPALYVHNALDFVVYGGADTASNTVVTLPAEVEAVVQERAER
jgi:ABC-2 type transport system ATP-binding protein